MSCYSDFSQGVIQSRFYSSQTQRVTADQLESYLAIYSRFRQAKFQGNLKEAERLSKQLQSDFEDRFRTDVVLLLRDAETERFFKDKKRESRVAAKTPQKSAGGFWSTFGSGGPAVELS